MNKLDIAYKLTNDVIKNYKIEDLESKYGTFGGKLATMIFNEILQNLNCPTSDNASVIFLGENELED